MPVELVLLNPDPETPTGLKGLPLPIAVPPEEAVYHSKLAVPYNII